MDSLQEYLVELSDRLDTQGKQACADAVDDLIKTASLQKLAQYVGVIGYVLKQNRAMGNCIRKKRVASSESMQNIVMQCLKEYQDGQNYQDTEWASKYAQVIKQDPKQFDVSHLFFLSSIGDAGNITEHIERVEKVANMLEENGIEEQTFNTILGHLSAFGDILSKDSETHANFKIAAPHRGWWSRFWNPSQFSLTNPRSWFKGVRERGQDLDAIQELESILTNLSALTRITQQVRTSISRLKAEANGYTSGSYEELNLPGGTQPVREATNVVEQLVKKIMALPQNDWNRSMLLLQQMRHLLANIPPENEYNRQIFDRAKNSIERIFGSMEEIYKILGAIQEDMETLRSREPILGRDMGLTEEGNRNPFGISSPAEEYGALQQVLEKLYENPMDTKAQWYAQKAHARLWDKLRYIQSPSEEGMNEWLSQEQEYPQYEEPAQGDDDDDGLEELRHTFDESEQRPSAPATEQPDQSQGMYVELDEHQTEQFEKLKNEELQEMLSKGYFSPNDVIDLLSYLYLIFDGPAQEEVGKLEEAIRDKIDNLQGGSTTNVSGQAYNSEQSETGYTPLHRPDTTASVDSFDLVKIADAADKVDSNVADVIDALIREQKGNKIDLLFPEFGVPVKEQAVEEKNNTI